MYLACSNTQQWICFLYWLLGAILLSYIFKLFFDYCKFKKEHQYSLDKINAKELNNQKTTEESEIKKLKKQLEASDKKAADLDKKIEDREALDKTKIELLKYAIEKSIDDNEKKKYIEKLIELTK